MRFPYMKIAIYFLTFLTYAYSGYGSNVISSLRDAIIAAEAVFGDVFKNVISVARKFKTVHEVFDAATDENCIFRCPDEPDRVPLKNKFYVPTSDGCGSFGLQISSEYLPSSEMELCCNEHDICYETCNNDKELCDLNFKRCLYKYCDSYEKTTANAIIVKSCKATAKMLFTGTITLGCKSYLDSQQRSCFCGPGQQGDQFSNGAKNKKYYKDKKQKAYYSN